MTLLLDAVSVYMYHCVKIRLSAFVQPSYFPDYSRFAHRSTQIFRGRTFGRLLVRVLYRPDALSVTQPTQSRHWSKLLCENDRKINRLLIWYTSIIVFLILRIVLTGFLYSSSSSSSATAPRPIQQAVPMTFLQQGLSWARLCADYNHQFNGFISCSSVLCSWVSLSTRASYTLTLVGA